MVKHLLSIFLALAMIAGMFRPAVAMPCMEMDETAMVHQMDGCAGPHQAMGHDENGSQNKPMSQSILHLGCSAVFGGCAQIAVPGTPPDMAATMAYVRWTPVLPPSKQLTATDPDPDKRPPRRLS